MWVFDDFQIELKGFWAKEIQKVKFGHDSKFNPSFDVGKVWKSE